MTATAALHLPLQLPAQDTAFWLDATSRRTDRKLADSGILKVGDAVDVPRHGAVMLKIGQPNAAN
jgi:hypothetical protein